MKVKFSDSAQIVLRNLDEDDRLRVRTWIDYLTRWETDPFIRRQAERLEGDEELYLLATNTKWRVFFSIKGEAITVLDVTTIDTILKTGAAGR